MNFEELAQWLDRIYATNDLELDCQQTQSRLPEYVEAQSGDSSPDRSALDIKAHLRQCPDCMETYLGLNYLVLAENRGAFLAVSDYQMAGVPIQQTAPVR